MIAPPVKFMRGYVHVLASYVVYTREVPGYSLRGAVGLTCHTKLRAPHNFTSVSIRIYEEYGLDGFILSAVWPVGAVARPPRERIRGVVRPTPTYTYTAGLDVLVHVA